MTTNAYDPEQTPTVEHSALRVTYPRPGVVQLQIISEPLGVLRVSVKRAMRATLEELEAKDEVRCLVLVGTERAFSVGSDIRDFRRDPSWLLEAEMVESGLNETIEGSRLPFIAACRGHTLGGGAVLALACDIILASTSAQFGFPEVRVGAFASGSGTQRLPRAVGRGRALELMLTGRIFGAEEALAMGLIQEVVEDDVLLDRTLDLAEEIAKIPPAAVAATKRCVRVGLREGVSAGLLLEMELAVAIGMTEDAAEGQRAFLEKREPRFITSRPSESAGDTGET